MPRLSLFFSLAFFSLSFMPVKGTGLLLRPIIDVPKLNEQSPDSCPFTCSLMVTDELICETVTEKSTFSQIPCKIDHTTDRFVIGNRTSIRRIFPAGLKDLNRPLTKYLSNSNNLLNIFLNLNILDLDQTSFLGLETVLEMVEILHVLNIHPETFQNHRSLTSFIVTSNKIPNISTEIAVIVSPEIIPSFLRLNPKDSSSPITFNIEVRCHRCILEDILSSPTIVTFPKKTESKSKDDAIDVLCLVYADSCPIIMDGLGCLQSNLGNETSVFPFVLKPAALTGWNLDVNNEGLIEPSNQNKHTGPLTLFLIIWCSVLTVFFVCLCVILFFKRRRAKLNVNHANRQNSSMYAQDTIVSLKRMTCRTASLEELNQQSFTSDVNGKWAYDLSSQRSSRRFPQQNGLVQNNILPPYTPDTSFPVFNDLPTPSREVNMRYSNDFGIDKQSLRINHNSWAPQTCTELNEYPNYKSRANGLMPAENPSMSRNSLPQAFALPSYKIHQDGLFQMY